MEKKGYSVELVNMAMKGTFEFKKPKSYSVVAMNLETIEDVDVVIRQCESIKEYMMSKKSIDGIKTRDFLEVPEIRFTEERDSVPEGYAAIMIENKILALFPVDKTICFGSTQEISESK